MLRKERFDVAYRGPAWPQSGYTLLAKRLRETIKQLAPATVLEKTVMFDLLSPHWDDSG